MELKVSLLSSSSLLTRPYTHFKTMALAIINEAEIIQKDNFCQVESSSRSG
jgi:hypothetical protein